MLDRAGAGCFTLPSNCLTSALGTGDFLITAGGGFPTLCELDFKVFGVSGTAALDSSAAGGDCNTFAGSVFDELD